MLALYATEPTAAPTAKGAALRKNPVRGGGGGGDGGGGAGGGGGGGGGGGADGFVGMPGGRCDVAEA